MAYHSYAQAGLQGATLFDSLFHNAPIIFARLHGIAPASDRPTRRRHQIPMLGYSSVMVTMSDMVSVDPGTLSIMRRRP
jgi:hypothetical protein